MKKVICIIFIFGLTVSFIGCSSGDKSVSANSTTTINNNTEDLNQQIDKLKSENDTLKTQIGEFHWPKENPPGTPSGWNVYRYLEYGYEVAYPDNYKPSISGGHSVAANPEFEMRLSLSSKDNQHTVDIDSINIDSFHTVDNFIKSKYKGEMLIDGSNVNYKIYRIKGDNYYFVFFSNASHIFQISSSAKDILQKIAQTFIFI